MRANAYNPKEVEPKWSQIWLREKIYKAVDGSPKPKSYILIEFPYPSGERLHLGHARPYPCMDAIARLRRMKGMNVLYPIGWDAFGLPAENYAIKTGIHPSVTTAKNIENAKAQAISWGLSFDWDREINTTDPKYYKWTQWIFVQLYKKGLAYKAEIAVNWCPSCKINLANEEVIEGNCERCGTGTERRMQEQWLLRITKYADRLLSDLETVDYREDIKLQQVNWIGKKEGARVKFEIRDLRFEIGAEVFTTRLDTIYGVTFIVVAPEVAVAWQKLGWEASEEVDNYIKVALNKSDEDRKKEEKKKTGVKTGLVAVNPANGEEVPVYVADYVLKDVGTGVVMGVPTYDDRDREFAEKYGLPIPEFEIENLSEITEREIKDAWAERMVTYHLRDWIFSRQHYWGEPIPMINCIKCGWVPVEESELPVELPVVEKYQPTDNGKSPLATMDDWMNTKCPKCGEKARRETDTMPNWAGSSWYYLRYIDPLNDSMLASNEKLKYWLPVDWYNGGMEHTTLHLLYSRFWHKFLFDLGVVPTAEPYAKRTSHGVVLGPDGRRMSKSRGNVINPDDVVNKYGADTLRMYEMFIGPFDQVVAWSWEGVEGVHRFLKRVWVLACEKIDEKNNRDSSQEAMRQISKMVRKVEKDLENTKFNTAVAAMMEWINWAMENKSSVGWDAMEIFIKCLAPMAPFMAEEIFQSSRAVELKSGSKFESVHCQQWPKTADNIEANEHVLVIVQVDGKVRGKLELESIRAGEREYIEKEALKLENVAKHIAGGKYGVVFVLGKVINFTLE